MRRPGYNLLVFTVVAAAVLTMSWRGTYAGTGDEPHLLLIAESIAFDADLDLANNYRQGSLVHPGHLYSEPHADTGRGGVLRPLHDLGLPLALAPWVRVAAALSATPATFQGWIVVAMAVLTGLLALQFLAIFGAAGASPAVAAGWSLLLTLSPPLVSHAVLFFPEIPSALLVAWLFRVLSDRAGKVSGLALPVGCATGFLLLLSSRNVALLLSFGVWAGVQLRREKASRARVLAFVAGLALPLLLRGSLFFLFWGSPIGGPEGSTDLPLPGEILSEVFVRTSGLFFDQEFGALPYAPVYLLMLAGLVRINERWRPGGRALVRIVLLFLATVALPYVNPIGWIGGWAPAGHMLVPIAPLLGIAVFTCVRRLTGAARVFASAVIAVQVGIDLLLWLQPALLWNDGDGTSDFLHNLPSLQRIIPVWHGPAPSPVPFIVAGLAWGAASVYLSRNAKSHQP